MLKRFYQHAKGAIALHNLKRDSALADAMVEQLEQRLEDTLEALSVARTEATTLRHKLQRAELRVSTPEARAADGGIEAAQAQRRAAMPGAQRRRTIGQDGHAGFWHGDHHDADLNMVDWRKRKPQAMRKEGCDDR